MIASAKACIVPVSTDGTANRQAHVPDDDESKKTIATLKFNRMRPDQPLSIPCPGFNHHPQAMGNSHRNIIHRIPK